MEDRRQHPRIFCNKMCILNLNETEMSCTLNNVSMGGALVHLHTPLLPMPVGNNCKIKMDADSISEYCCNIVRAEPTNIILEFISMDEGQAAGFQVANL
jgi:hypothetical protein